MKKYIPTCILFLCFIVLFSSQLYFVNQAKDTLPEVICLRSEKDMYLSFKEMDGFSDATAVSQSEATIATTYNNDYHQVNLWLTNDQFPKVMNLKCKYGSFFSGQSGVEQNRFIVISDQLAIRYFKTDNVVGKSMVLNDHIYTICGVYEESKSLLNQLSQNSLSMVYAPYQSHMGKDPLTAQFVYVKSKSEFISSAYGYVQDRQSSIFYYESASNYNDVRHLIAQTISITVALCGLTALIWLALLFIKQGQKSYQLYKTDGLSKGFYRASAWVGIILIAGIFVCCFTRFDVFLPADWLPDEKIFDLPFYKDKMISIFQLKNGTSLCDPYWNYTYLSFFICSVISILSSISFYVMSYFFINLYPKLKKTN